MTSSPRVEAKHDRSRTFSSLRVKMGAHAADVLKRLPQPFESAELRCPECGRESRVAPPFDLRRFSCRLCAAYVHPFVWVEGAPVDLVAMRAMLAAIHYDVKVAEHVLLALKLEPNDVRVMENGTDGKVVKVEPVDWPIKVQLLVDNGIGLGNENLSNLRNGVRGLIDALPM